MMNVLKSDVIATLDLIDKAQRLVAKLEQAQDEHRCDGCRNDVLDIKILLDGAYTRWRDDVIRYAREEY